MSAAKNDKEKVDLSLIPYISNLEHAKAFMVGQKKYGRYNYCKGHNASQLVAALLRHANAWNSGEEFDPTDGQHHLGSVMACCSMILRQQELGTLKDDRFKAEPVKEESSLAVQIPMTAEDMNKLKQNIDKMVNSDTG